MRTRREKNGSADIKAVQPWMLTMVDVMTLLMTFFIVLISLSTFDELSQQEVLDSVKTIFGTEKAPLFPLDTLRRDEQTRYGLIDNERSDSLQNIREILLENDTPSGEVLISQTGKHIIISINNDLMFEPGRMDLSVEGKKILTRLVPYLRSMTYPMLIAGHSSTGMNEEMVTVAMLDSGFTEPLWVLSMDRATEVYNFFILGGLRAASMNMEAYGDHRPRFSSHTDEGRRNNRRVDLVLDKRNELFGKESDMRKNQNTDRNFYFKSFKFDLTYPKQQ
ncbi:MAG: OmpA family protein [Deltaproteobacteria bacterium]|jgi:chemotaxis protein MotB|nr:OmpA family protein [Deltaproteobacteria bacterium]